MKRRDALDGLAVIGAIILIAFVAACFLYLQHQCESQHGVLVRSLFAFECVRPLE